LGNFRIKALAALMLPALALPVIAADSAIEEVVVTGSYIKSSPTDGASPIQVVGRDNIDEMAAVTIGDITRNLAVNSGSENVPDSFNAGQSQGTSNINLRGLGLGSTLVLVNGRRNTLAAATANDGSSFVDTAMIPAVALQRVEVLKEGAASIYGSDAVAGVVNFITRKDFEGTEIGAFHQGTTSDSQDDTQLSIIHGWANDRTNIVVSAEYLDRNPLSSAARPELSEFAVSGLGNSFLLFGPSTVANGPYAGTYGAFENVPDAACTDSPLGVLIPQANGDRCGFKYGPRFNIVNKEERTHLYGNVQHNFDNGMTANIEMMWGNVKVLDNPQSPTYPALSYLDASRAIGPNQAGNPFGVPALWLGRPLGAAFPSPFAPRDNEHFRFSAELDGDIGDYHFNTALTSSSYDGYAEQPDTQTSRFDDAIAGVGGPNGNESWNLFNPTANSQELIDFVSALQITSTETELTTFDLVFDGELGELNFAAGMQIRDESLVVARNDLSTVEFDTAGNLTKAADLIFLGGGVNVDESRTAWAVFTEFQWDATDDLEFRVAGRYEDLDTASTFDPKLSARYQVMDGLVLRGSASTSFRQASLHQLYNSVVALQGIQDFDQATGAAVGGTAFIRIAQNANVNLQPEEATNVNLGVIWDPIDSLHITADYWSVDYTNVITIENAQGKVISDPSQADVKRASDGTLIGVTTNYINAAQVDTDGLDFAVDYYLPVSDFGDMGISFSAMHMLSYEIPVNGVATDVSGFFNHDNFARSLPETQANTTFRWSKGAHKASVISRYISSYANTRPNPPAGLDNNVDSFMTFDVQYGYELELSDVVATITVGMLNATDEAPPRVWDAANFSFDPRQHDSRGRMAYVGFKVGF
jgi:iron complex outermembrane receptor protein